MGDEPMQPSGNLPEPNTLPKSDPPVDHPLSAGQRLDRLIGKTKQFSAAFARQAKSVTDTAAPKLKQMGDTATAKMRKLSDEAGSTIRQAAEIAPGKSMPVGHAASRPPENQAGGFFPARLRLVRNYFNAGGKLRKALIIYGGLLILSLLLSPIALLLPNTPILPGVASAPDPTATPQPDKESSLDPAASTRFWGSYSGDWTLNWSDNGVGGVVHLTATGGGISRVHMDLPWSADIPSGQDGVPDTHRGGVAHADMPSEGGTGAGVQVTSDHSAVLDLGSNSEGSYGKFELQFSGPEITGKTMWIGNGKEIVVHGTVQ